MSAAAQFSIHPSSWVVMETWCEDPVKVSGWYWMKLVLALRVYHRGKWWDFDEFLRMITSSGKLKLKRRNSLCWYRVYAVILKVHLVPFKTFLRPFVYILRPQCHFKLLYLRDAVRVWQHRVEFGDKKIWIFNIYIVNLLEKISDIP